MQSHGTIELNTVEEASMTKALLQAVEEIRPIIEEHAASAEANRRLSNAVYDAMYRAGYFPTTSGLPSKISVILGGSKE